MKKMLFTLAIVAAAFSAVTLTTSCKKKETAGEKLDKAIDSTESGINKFTKKAEDAYEDANDSIEKTMKDMQK